jgi:DNA polymerase-3 subunit beta
MIFSKEYVGYLARQVVRKLQDGHFMQTSEPGKVTEQVQASMIEELSLEDRINDEVRVILPRKTLMELGRLLAEGEGDIQYERGENHLFFEIGGRLLISRMIDGQFPAFERVIPKGNDKRIDFDRDRLTSAVKRVALLSNERSRAVKFQIDKGKVEIASSSPEFGEAKEVLMVEYAGTPVTICFNAQYILDFLGVVETDAVGLEFKDEMSQAVMKPIGADGYDYTYVIMPMRV